MKCLFCAEEIQDAAILCRYCGAEKREGQWFRPNQPSPKAPLPKGTFTIKSAGVLFLISGVVSIFSIASDVPLFGAMRGGATAICYNLIFVALFFSMGVGLIMGKPWGYTVILSGTLLYSLDRAIFLMDQSARTAYLAASPLTKTIEPLLSSGLLDPDVDINSMLDQLTLATALTSIACWWGFAAYIYLRRDYFHGPASASSR